MVAQERGRPASQLYRCEMQMPKKLPEATCELLDGGAGTENATHCDAIVIPALQKWAERGDLKERWSNKQLLSRSYHRLDMISFYCQRLLPSTLVGIIQKQYALNRQSPNSTLRLSGAAFVFPFREGGVASNKEPAQEPGGWIATVWAMRPI